MHETDFSHEHSETVAERAAIARTIWAQDNLTFTTVGIDIGSSTAHLLFARLALQRQSQGLSSRLRKGRLAPPPEGSNAPGDLLTRGIRLNQKAELLRRQRK